MTDQTRCVFWYLQEKAIQWLNIKENAMEIEMSAIHMPKKTIQSVVQIMAWHLFGTKPLSQLLLAYCLLGHPQQTSVKLKSTIIQQSFKNIQFKNICKILVILSWPLWINLFTKSHKIQQWCMQYSHLLHYPIIIHYQLLPTLQISRNE